MLIGDRITLFLFLVFSLAWKEAGKRLEMQAIAVVPRRLVGRCIRGEALRPPVLGSGWRWQAKTFLRGVSVVRVCMCGGGEHCSILLPKSFRHLESVRQCLETAISGSEEDTEAALCVHLLGLSWEFSF